MEKNNLKIFFIKLGSITFAIIIIINVVYNLIFAEKLEKINSLLELDKSKFRNDLRMKIRKEIKNGLEKENIFNEEDKILIYKLYKKIQKEFKEMED